MCAWVRIPLLSNFAFKKPTFWSKQYFLESNQEQDEADFTIQEGVNEDRMKKFRYTQGRMAERSKPPDSRNSPLRLLVHERVRGFEPNPCHILRSKRQHSVRSSTCESNEEQDEADFTLQEGVIGFPDAVPSRGGERISQKQHRPKLWDVLRGRKNSKQIPFLGREWPGNSRIVHLKQPEGVNCCPPGRGTKENCRHRKMVIRWCLRDIHPNPGPRGTDCDKWIERKFRKMRVEERKQRRKAKRERKWQRLIAERKTSRPKGLTGKANRRERERWQKKIAQKFSARKQGERIATWNVQRCKIRVDGRGRIQHILRTIEEHKWDVVLLSEITSKESGVWWYEENAVLVHSNRAAVVLRNQWASDCKKGGSRKWLSERVAMVTVNKKKFIAVYQPVSPNEFEIDRYRKDLETAMKCRRRDEILLIGGDHNAQIGRHANKGKESTIGQWGLRNSTEAGTELVEWAQQNELVVVDSFFQKRSRGRWCHPKTGKWYELDFFLAKKHRNLAVQNMTAVPEDRWSDHRPKEIRVLFGKKKEQFKNSKTENIDWKKLRSEKSHVAYQKEIVNTSLREEPSWNDLANVMKKAAKKVCGLQDTRSKTNQWMVGHEDEASEFKVKIQTLVKERNATKEKDELREKLKTTRREYKKKLKTWENEWWNNLLKECEEAMLRQDIGEMYSILKQLGLRDQVIPNSESTLISAETFKEHFERIQEKRDENSLAQKVQARKIIRKFAKPSTEGQRAAQELNECPSEEEVMKEWKKIKEKAPGEEAIRIIYLKSSPPWVPKKISMLCRRCSKVPLRIGMT